MLDRIKSKLRHLLKINPKVDHTKTSYDLNMKEYVWELLEKSGWQLTRNTHVHAFDNDYSKVYWMRHIKGGTLVMFCDMYRTGFMDISGVYKTIELAPIGFPTKNSIPFCMYRGKDVPDWAKEIQDLPQEVFDRIQLFAKVQAKTYIDLVNYIADNEAYMWKVPEDREAEMELKVKEIRKNKNILRNLKKKKKRK